MGPLSRATISIYLSLPPPMVFIAYYSKAQNLNARAPHNGTSVFPLCMAAFCIESLHLPEHSVAATVLRGMRDTLQFFILQCNGTWLSLWCDVVLHFWKCYVHTFLQLNAVPLL
jgi:hypothetical protein